MVHKTTSEQILNFLMVHHKDTLLGRLIQNAYNIRRLSIFYTSEQNLLQKNRFNSGKQKEGKTEYSYLHDLFLIL